MSTLEARPVSQSLKAKLARVERVYIEQALAEHGQDKVKAAKALGISRRSLYYKLARCGSPTS